MRNYLLVLSLLSLSLNAACTTAESPATNAVSPNANSVKIINAADLPSGFSTSPVPMSANSTPGIPGPNDANKIPSGNIPGIPDANKMSKNPQTKKTPPIPGIPDQETIKKQMNTPLQDVNIVNNPPKSASDANNQPAEKPRGNSRQP